MKEQIRAGVADPVTNITTLSDKTIDESFGADEGIKSSNIVHQSIIKRFNQHSIMVMNAGKDRLIAAPPQDPQEKADLKKEIDIDCACAFSLLLAKLAIGRQMTPPH